VGVVVLIRHGETTWSATGQHTSITDLDLTPRGEQQAVELGGRLSKYRFTEVLCSPRTRAKRTAELAGLPITAIDGDLAEWYYGDYEGLTTDQVRAQRPDWSLWTDGGPGGESPEQVGVRVDRLLDRVRAILQASDGGDVALVAHGHILRVIGARWVGLPVSAGALITLDTASLSTLGEEHGQSAIAHWNVTL
jgi:broad specificity phosphatase PhoE